MSVNEKMTAIADRIRSYTSKTDKLSLDGMASGVDEVNLAGYRVGLTVGDGQGYDRGHIEGYAAGKNVGFQEGVASVPDYLPIATTVLFNDWNLFNKSDIVFNIPLVTDYFEAFESNVLNTTVEHLTINGALNGKIKDAEYAFDSSSSLNTNDEKLTRVTLNCDFSQCKSFHAMFARRSALKIIDGTPIDFSGAVNIGSFVAQCFSLEELRVKEGSIKVALNLISCGNLSNETKQSVFKGLATVTTSRTLTLHSSLKILQSQVDSANAKGWTVSGGTVVSEEEYYG